MSTQSQVERLLTQVELLPDDTPDEIRARMLDQIFKLMAPATTNSPIEQPEIANAAKQQPATDVSHPIAPTTTPPPPQTTAGTVPVGISALALSNPLAMLPGGIAEVEGPKPTDYVPSQKESFAMRLGRGLGSEFTPINNSEKNDKSVTTANNSLETDKIQRERYSHCLKKKKGKTTSKSALGKGQLIEPDRTIFSTVLDRMEEKYIFEDLYPRPDVQSKWITDAYNKEVQEWHKEAAELDTEARKSGQQVPKRSPNELPCMMSANDLLYKTVNSRGFNSQLTIFSVDDRQIELS